jgi:hypothetical protein
MPASAGMTKNGNITFFNTAPKHIGGYDMTSQYVMLILLFAAGIAFVILLFYRHEKKRREALKIKAQTLGFSYLDKTGLDQIPASAIFHLFSVGRAKRILSLMQKDEEGVRTSIFDYDYTTGGGKSQHTHRQTVFLFETPRLRLLAFSLRPENVFHRIGQSFGAQDIDFPDHPEFSKKWLLKGDDEAAIRKVFNGEVLSVFESAKGMAAEAKRGALLLYRPEKRVIPEMLFESYEVYRKLCWMFIRRSEYV